MVTAAARQRSGRSSVHLDGDDDAFATPAVGDTFGQRSRFNLFSGTASAVISASLALCCILTCAYCYRARRRTISNTRRRFLLGMRDLDLVLGTVRGADDPPSPSPHDVAGRTANLDDAPPSPPAVRFGTARPFGAPPHPDVARHANPGTVAGWTTRPSARYATMDHGTDRPAEFPAVPRATPSLAGPRSSRPTAGAEPPFPAGRRASFGPGDCPVWPCASSPYTAATTSRWRTPAATCSTCRASTSGSPSATSAPCAGVVCCATTKQRKCLLVTMTLQRRSSSSDGSSGRCSPWTAPCASRQLVICPCNCIG